MKVLIALDLSKSSFLILEKVKAILCGEHLEKIWLVHVAEPEPDFVGNDVAVPSDRQYLARKYHEEHQELQAMAKDFRDAGFDCVALLVQGSIAETIRNMSRQMMVDVVVAGSHGKGIAKHLLLGSTSEDLLETTTLPLLVIPVSRDTGG